MGAYDGNAVLLVERVADGQAPTHAGGLPRRRLWQVRARQLVLATGALERPIVFPGNDRPGVMLAGAARAYATRCAVVPGARRRLHDERRRATARRSTWPAAGVEVAAIVDARVAVDASCARPRPPPASRCCWARAWRPTHGDGGVEAVDVAPLGHFEGAPRRIECDLLAVSGGFDPVARPAPAARRADALRRGARLPRARRPGAGAVRLAGAAAAACASTRASREGADAGAAAAATPGFDAAEPDWPVAGGADGDGAARRCWLVPAADGRAGATAFVDLHRDVTVRDVAARGRRRPALTSSTSSATR